jgi:hypothetical protein
VSTDAITGADLPVPEDAVAELLLAQEDVVSVARGLIPRSVLEPTVRAIAAPVVAAKLRSLAERYSGNDIAEGFARDLRQEADELDGVCREMAP